ncbi:MULTISPECIES: metallopeptidase family protein [Microbacterium]|uniref:metallopeptidase family protein n=1 Tax=Microbacterium TaxID=33882 RepID=UPI0004B6D516|nr:MULTISPECIES: metallopeptidase family protein [Microbacterium]MDO8382411.1 metallopeptidase family protein [Microbacterium sp.]
MIARRGKSARGGDPGPRPDRHGRHGRQGRSPVVRPPIGPLDTRFERFDIAVGAASDFLRSAWPELRDVEFHIGHMPAEPHEDGIPRWSIDREARRIVLFRIPIERLVRTHRDDELHRRMMIEGNVFRAAAEYLDRDPWDLGPERFRYF